VNGSEAISIVSIASGALVAIMAPLVSSWREDRRADRRANDARLDELRSVLDAGSLALATAEQSMIDASIALTVTRDLDVGNAEIANLRVANEDVHRAAAQLQVRLSIEHPIHAVYAAAMMGLAYGLGALLLQAIVVRDATDLRAQHLGWMDADYQWHNAQRRVSDGRREFARLCSQVVGPNAPVGEYDASIDVDVSVPKRV
jgi:hypothetical protein